MLCHRAQQADGSIYIDAVVLEWDLARLANSLERGEVDDIVNIRMFIEDLVQPRLVRDITAVEYGSLAADELDAVQALFGGIVQVVDDDDLVVSLEKGKSGERADVADASTAQLVVAVRSSAGSGGSSAAARQWASQAT